MKTLERPNHSLDAAAVVRRSRRLRFLVKPEVVSALAGAYLGSRPGTGLAFSELRPYEPGDDVRHLDWNVTARQGRPYVRRYVEERALELRLVLDVSASMRFGPPGRGKADRAAQAAALLASAAIQNQDVSGLMLVTDRVEFELPPAGGSRHLALLLRALVTAPSSSRSTNLATGADRLGGTGRRGLVVLISDFQNPGPAATWRKTCRRRRLVALRVIDPRERVLPEVGRLAIEDPETGRVTTIDTSRPEVRAAYTAAAAKRDGEFQLWCREARAESLELDTAADPIRPLLRYFRAKSRRRARFT